MNNNINNGEMREKHVRQGKSGKASHSGNNGSPDSRAAKAERKSKLIKNTPKQTSADFFFLCH
jgi:hypothetical protein